MLKYYSKPVLTNEENSSYQKEIKFNLSIIDSSIDNEFIKMIIKIEMTSEVLKSYLVNQRASIGIKIKTNLYTKFEPITAEEETYEILVEKNKLERYDSINCVAYIITNEELQFNWNEELRNIYDRNWIFNFKKNEIMAESSEDKLDYRVSGTPFISLSEVSDQDGKGLLFSIDTPNMIQVKIGKELNEAIGKLRNEEKKVSVKGILDTFIVFNSILFSLMKIMTSEEYVSYKEKEWYKALDYCFEDEKYDSFDDFIIAMQNDIDINEIYRVTQVLLNNQLEVKIIDTWRRSR